MGRDKRFIVVGANNCYVNIIPDDNLNSLFTKLLTFLKILFLHNISILKNNVLKII